MNTPNLWASTYNYILKNHTGSESGPASDTKFWLDSLSWNKAERLGPGRIKVFFSVNNPFYANFINATFKTEIEHAVTQVLGESCEIQIDTINSIKPADEIAALKMQSQNFTPSQPLSPLSPPSAFDLTPAQTEIAMPSFQTQSGKGSFSTKTNTVYSNADVNLVFDNYIVGPSNQFAYASAVSTAESPAVQYNPLFIYGPPAVGKTHLLHAIANRIKQKHPHIRSYFVSAENFVNEFIESIQHKNPGEFRAKYRENVDLLLIDDVQFIVGKHHSEEEFIHTFNTLHSLKKMIILTSDKAPKDIEGLEERIRTRFEMGLVADIRPPEIETRIAILKAKAESDDIYLPDEVATFLGTYVKDTVRNLHGALVKLQQFASLTGSEITLELAKQVLQQSIPEEGQEYTVEMITSAVCKHFNIKIKDLKGVSRAKNFSLPRQISMYLIRKYTSLGFREIGQIFGKDHSTVIHAIDKIDANIDSDLELKRNIESISEQL